eukprot:6861215-Prorocentrum_lima.AAC.1
MNHRIRTDAKKDSQKMHYATALREARERKEAEGVVTGIAGNAPEAINPSPIEPEPMQQEIAKWKKLRFMDP